jgi:hypothetical protein
MDSSTALPIWHPNVPGGMRLFPLAVKGTFTLALPTMSKW